MKEQRTLEPQNVGKLEDEQFNQIWPVFCGGVFGAGLWGGGGLGFFDCGVCCISAGFFVVHGQIDADLEISHRHTQTDTDICPADPSTISRSYGAGFAGQKWSSLRETDSIVAEIINKCWKRIKKDNYEF